MKDGNESLIIEGHDVTNHNKENADEIVIFKEIMEGSFLNDDSFEDKFYKKAFYNLEKSSMPKSDYILRVMELEKIFSSQKEVVKKIILMERIENILLAEKEIKVGNVYFTLNA